MTQGSAESCLPVLPDHFHILRPRVRSRSLANNKIFLSFSEIGIIMRIFLVNFIHTSAGQSYNADFVLMKQETFPTSREIYKRIKSAAVERGLHVHGPILWTGITELNESDEQQFNREEE
jgi:hypothetical protein